MQSPPRRKPACPRCQGQVYFDRLEAQYSCLQCGWRQYAPPLPQVRRELRHDRRTLKSP